MPGQRSPADPGCPEHSTASAMRGAVCAVPGRPHARRSPWWAQLAGAAAASEAEHESLGFIFCPHFGLGAMPVRLVRAVLTTALAIEVVGATANLFVKFRRRRLSRTHGSGCRMRRRNRNRGDGLPGNGLLRSGHAGRSLLRGGFLWSGRIRRHLILSHSCSHSPQFQYRRCRSGSIAYPILQRCFAPRMTGG